MAGNTLSNPPMDIDARYAAVVDGFRGAISRGISSLVAEMDAQRDPAAALRKATLEAAYVEPASSRCAATAIDQLQTQGGAL